MGTSVVVIGAGQAGLAAGRALQAKGCDFVILEQSDRVGGSWPHYYDSLTLFSPAPFSSLPDEPFPGGEDIYPRRDDVADYLARYAERFALPIQLNMRVTAVTPRPGSGFLIETENSRTIEATAVVVATGTFEAPRIPEIDGGGEFAGTVIHSSTYQGPDAFAGRRVIVVGAANSAVQIAVELAEHARVTLAVRKPVRYAPQKLWGRDVHYWFGKLGVDRASFLSDQSTPVLDDGRYRASLVSGRPDQRRMFKSFWRDGVVWADDQRERADVVIFATGFRPHAPFLSRALGFTADGKLAQRAGVSTTTPGLFFVGQPGLRSFSSATLRGVGRDAAHVVQRLIRYLKPARRSGALSV